MRWGRIYIIPTESMLTVPPTSLQSAWYARSLQNKYVAPASSAWCVRRWHRARTLEAWLSKSQLALNLHLSAAQTVPATHLGGAPPCAARTCLLRSRRGRSARSSYCTLFNNRCVLSACSAAEQICGACVLCVTRTSVAPGTHVGGTAVEVRAGIKFAFVGRPNRCMFSACSCVSQNTHRRRASAVRFSAFRLPNPSKTPGREVHGGLWPRLYFDNVVFSYEPHDNI